MAAQGQTVYAAAGRRGLVGLRRDHQQRPGGRRPGQPDLRHRGRRAHRVEHQPAGRDRVERRPRVGRRRRRRRARRRSGRARTWQNAPGIAAGDAMRMVPDLSTMADPATAFIDYFTGNASGTCGDCAADWNAIGGTSAGPPLLSALTAVGAQACAVDRLGFLNPTLLRHGAPGRRLRRRDGRGQRPLRRRRLRAGPGLRHGVGPRQPQRDHVPARPLPGADERVGPRRSRRRSRARRCPAPSPSR